MTVPDQAPGDRSVSDRLLHTAQRYVEARRPERAIQTLDRIGLASSQVLLVRAEALLQLERFEEAVGTARRAFGDPESDTMAVQLLDIICIANCALGRGAAALQAIEAARRLAPADPLLLCHHAGAIIVGRSGLRFADRRAQALAFADRALALAPADAEIVKARLGLARGLGDRESQEELAGRLLALDPTSGVAHLTLAELHGEKARVDEARWHLSLGTKADPGGSEVPRAAAQVWAAGHPLAWPQRLFERNKRWQIFAALSVAGFAFASLGTVVDPSGTLVGIGELALIAFGITGVLLKLLQRQKRRELQRRRSW